MSKPQDVDPEKIKKIISGLSAPQLQAAIKHIKAINKKTQKESIYYFNAHPAQVPILSSRKMLKVVKGGNRSGKTHATAFETACHLTGWYPDWWDGYRFHEPITAGIVSVDMEQMVKGLQYKLLGWPDEFGTGMIPKELIDFDSLRYKQQSSECLSSFAVKHVSGGVSRAFLMTFSQQIKSFMGFFWDYVHFDEEPPFDIYDEVKMRMLDRGGRLVFSFYPSEGETELTQHFDQVEEKHPEYIDQFYLQWEDNSTLDQESVKMNEATMTDEQKEKRKYGRTGNKEGLVIPYSRDVYTCEPFELEPYWKQLGAVDMGFGHGTGGVCAALDQQADVIYVYKEYYSKDQVAAIHASALRMWGDVTFIADPPANRQSATDGKTVAGIFQDYGLDIVVRQIDKEASISMLLTRISEGRLFVFSTCRILLDQMARYRRKRSDKTGVSTIVKKDDDVIDPLRSIVYSLEYARTPGTRRREAFIDPPVKRIVPVDKKLGI